MSGLTDVEKRYLEKILNMSSGYVLDYSDATFEEFFYRYQVNIHSDRYQTYGTSKAKKMRAFWEREPDDLVARVLSEMLDSYEADCDLSGRERDASSLEKSRAIVAKLSGKPPTAKAASVKSFLHKEFEIPSIQRLPVEFPVAKIIEGRLNEARAALSVDAYLSVIFLCGSVLEGVLLGAAQREPAKFNRSLASPKSPDGKVKSFQDWSLAQFIDVACDINVLKPDVKEFSHGLRHFRNYIHPYEQMASMFTPDEHTAKVCFQALKAALASVAGERQ